MLEKAIHPPCNWSYSVSVFFFKPALKQINGDSVNIPDVLQKNVTVDSQIQTPAACVAWAVQIHTGTRVNMQIRQPHRSNALSTCMSYSAEHEQTKTPWPKALSYRLEEQDPSRLSPPAAHFECLGVIILLLENSTWFSIAAKKWLQLYRLMKINAADLATLAFCFVSCIHLPCQNSAPTLPIVQLNCRQSGLIFECAMQGAANVGFGF